MFLILIRLNVVSEGIDSTRSLAGLDTLWRRRRGERKKE